MSAPGMSWTTQQYKHYPYLYREDIMPLYKSSPGKGSPFIFNNTCNESSGPMLFICWTPLGVLISR